MKIKDIRTESIITPLKKKFKTALRSVDEIENICVFIETDKGFTGLGCAVPTAVITGETAMSIKGAIKHIHENLSGLDVRDFEIVMQRLHACMEGNNSAKAAVDMALYDIIGKFYTTPLYRFLGGDGSRLETDMTVSLGTLEEMAKDAREAVENGFSILKLKLGREPGLDVNRLKAVRQAVGPEIRLRIDANQGWSPKQAVFFMERIAREDITIDLLEQPVHAKDYKGMKFVRDNTDVPVYADESVFSPRDAMDIINMDAVDGINIKLMKCGGIYNALKIAAIAESAGVGCMIGSMMESHIGVTAAAHLASAKKSITGYDLDAPLFVKESPAQGGITYNASTITLPDLPGLGIQNINC